MNAMPLNVSHARRTHWYVVSAAVVQVSAWQACNGTADTEKVHALTAVGMPTARQPCCSVLGEPVGRPGGEPDGGRDQHDGLARWWAGVATERRGYGLADYQIFVSWSAVEM